MCSIGRVPAPSLVRDWDCSAAIASSNSFQTKYSSYEPALEHVRSRWYEKPDFFPAGALESNFGLILFLHPRAPRMMRSPQPLKRGRNSEERCAAAGSGSAGALFRHRDASSPKLARQLRHIPQRALFKASRGSGEQLQSKPENLPGTSRAGMAEPAQVPLSRLVVPMLLALGWLVGCALMVYIVFS